MAGLDEGEALKLALGGIGPRVELASAGRLYALAAGCARRLLDPDEALRSALDRLEPLLRPEDGDGPWRPGLAAPRPCRERSPASSTPGSPRPKPD